MPKLVAPLTAPLTDRGYAIVVTVIDNRSGEPVAGMAGLTVWPETADGQYTRDRYYDRLPRAAVDPRLPVEVSIDRVGPRSMDLVETCRIPPAVGAALLHQVGATLVEVADRVMAGAPQVVLEVDVFAQAPTALMRFSPDGPGVSSNIPTRCGTDRGYKKHIEHGEDACEPCRVAHAATEQRRRQTRKQARAAGKTPQAQPAAKCGTRGGYNRHRREGTEICGPCRDAYNAEQRTRDHARREEQGAPRAAYQSFETSAAMAATWIAEHKTLPAKSIEVEGFKLGAWVHNQRARHKRGELAADKVAALEAIDGWIWRD